MIIADRQVKATGKKRDGDISKLCNRSEHWSPRSREDAISDIENGRYTYYVQWGPHEKSEIKVVRISASEKYLRTDRDNTRLNDLHDLPDC